MQTVLDTTDLLGALRDDERVHGVVRLAPTDGRTRLVIATTWDGLNAVAARLPELAALIVATNDAALVHDGARVDVLTSGGERLELRATRVSDLKPSAEGERGEPLLDPRGLLRQWVDWSIGRPRDESGNEDDATQGARRRVLACDDALRAFEALVPGCARLSAQGGEHALRQAVAERIRVRVENLAHAPAADALAERARAALRGIPRAAAGLRFVGRDARRRFLSAADDEGFGGDRALLDAAEAHVRAVTGRVPVFEAGFALATFDQVEARYAIGEAVGGCKPPLVPGLLVGVAVTPADDLAIFAAPTLREPTCGAACVADGGERAVVTRGAGMDHLVSALTDAVGGALESLPSLLRRARGAHRERPDAPEALLRALHLPRSFAVAAADHGALASGTSRLLVALSVARAATDMEPTVARKLELAAGRLLLGAAETGDCVEPS